MLPENPVKVGDKWDANIEIPIGGGQPGILKAQLEFVSVEEVNGQKLAKIKFAGKVDADVNEGGIEMKITSEKYDGVTEFNIDLGTFTRSETEAIFNMGMGQQGSMKMDAKINITLTEAK